MHGKSTRIIVGAGALLAAPVAGAGTAEAGPTDDSPTLAEQRHIRDQHRATEPQPAPPAARAPSPAPTSVPPPPPQPAPEPRPRVDPSHVRGSDGLTPGQRRHIQADTPTPPPAPAATPAPEPEPEPEPEPQPEPEIDPSHVRGSDGFTPGQRRHVQTEVRNQEASSGPPTEAPTPEPPPEPESDPSHQRGPDGLTPYQRRLVQTDTRNAAATPLPAAPVVDPSHQRGSDGLTPAQRELIQGEERAAESQPRPVEGLTPAQRHLVEAERRAAAAQPQPEGPPVEAKVMNWNLGRGASIDHGQGTDPNELDEVARTIAEEQPDIVTLQEVYVEFTYVDGIRKNYENDVDKILRIIEDETGVRYHAAPIPARPNWELDDNIARDRRVGLFGNVVLSREPILRHAADSLPWDGTWPRLLQAVRTTVDGVEVSVYNTHLTEEPLDHPDQIDQAFDTAGRPDRPTIFAGDFNVGYTGTDPYALGDGFTRLTDRRGLRCNGTGRDQIDQVYGAGGVTGSQRPGFECGPSDHPYQVVDVDIPRG